MKKRIIVLILIIATIVAMFLIPEIQYRSAVQWLSNASKNNSLTDDEYLHYTSYFSNNSKYKENTLNFKKLKYLKATQLLDNDSFEDSIKLFQELGEYEDSKNKVEEIKELKKEKEYEKAIQEYTNGNFNKAKELFNLIDDNYKEKQQYLNKIEKVSSIQGNYELGINFITINKWNITYGYTSMVSPNQYKTSTYTLEDNIIKYIEIMGYSLEFERELHVDFENKQLFDPRYNLSYTFVNSSTEIPESKKEPSIGMTSTEVENSTWGEPNKKNKNTYSWGTTEQWVYKNKGYIYFENGIVTSISER